MIAIRQDMDHGTEIAVYADATQHSGYRIMCLNFDYDPHTDRRDPPTVWIHAPETNRLTVTDARRMAREFDHVVDIAEQLQAEKRAAYAAKEAS